VINDCRFRLTQNVQHRSGEVLISRNDLCKLIDPILRPQHLTLPDGAIETVVIDPGHGGIDSGTKWKQGEEKFYTLDLAQRLRGELEKQGLKVLLTRDGDTNPARTNRAQLATDTPRSVLISLHFNNDRSSRLTNGIETYAMTPQWMPSTNDPRLLEDGKFSYIANEQDGAGLALATAVHANLVRRLQVEDRAVRRARFEVIRECRRPAILIEGGYLSNAGEATRIHAPEFRQSLAQAIAEGVQQFRTALGKSAAPPR
jgi:N-acetylmuramoyl-L-alanine amidase